MEAIGHRMLLQLLRKDEADPEALPVNCHFTPKTLSDLRNISNSKQPLSHI